MYTVHTDTYNMLYLHVCVQEPVATVIVTKVLTAKVTGIRPTSMPNSIRFISQLTTV